MKRKGDLNLRTRGLILTLLPLIVQIVFVAWLCNQLWAIQRQSAEVGYMRELASQIHSVALQTGAGVYFMHATGPSKNLDPETVERQSMLLIKMANKLVNLAKVTPKLEEDALNVRVTLQALLTTLNNMNLAQSRHDVSWKRIRIGFWQQMTDRGYDFYRSASAMLSDLPTSALDSTELMKASALRIERAFIILIVVDLIMAGCLAYWYIKQIRSPLRKIRDDSIRLSARQPLSPASANQDEIGDLDRFLHHVCDSINEAVDKEKQLFENAMDLVCSLDERGLFLRANERSQPILGVASSDLPGRSIFDFCKSESDKADLALLATATGKTVTSEFRLSRSDSSSCDTRWSFVKQPVTNEIFCVVHDNSEEKRIEQMKQDFFDMIGHDLREPLTSMLDSVVNVDRGSLGEVPSGVTAELIHIRKNIERLVDLVNDLLNFEKLKAGTLQLDVSEFNLAETARESSAAIESLATAKNIKIEIEGTQSKCNGDKSKIGQVILNLLTNAIKFSEEGSSIQIAVSETDQAVQLSVEDSGPGIPAAYAEKIFEPFEQVPGGTNRGGTGLGLAICKMLVEAHGGTIGVRPISPVANADETQESTMRGSVFWFTIPLSKAAIAETI